jgi:hypothetical protein
MAQEQGSATAAGGRQTDHHFIKYKSKHHNDREAQDDTQAKQSLSSHSYKMFADSLQHAQRSQHRETEEGNFIVWTSKVSEEEALGKNIHVFPRQKDALARIGNNI